MVPPATKHCDKRRYRAYRRSRPAAVFLVAHAPSPLSIRMSAACSGVSATTRCRNTRRVDLVGSRSPVWTSSSTSAILTRPHIVASGLKLCMPSPGRRGCRAGRRSRPAPARSRPRSDACAAAIAAGPIFTPALAPAPACRRCGRRWRCQVQPWWLRRRGPASWPRSRRPVRTRSR
jgi:hypothetical protein